MSEKKIIDDIYASYLLIPTLSYKKLLEPNRFVLPVADTDSVLDKTFFINGVPYEYVMTGLTYYFWASLVEQGDVELGDEYKYLQVSDCVLEPLTTNKFSGFKGVSSLFKQVELPVPAVSDIEEQTWVAEYDQGD